MNADERKAFDKIVTGWERRYEQSIEVDGVPDNPMTKTAFYGACLTILKQGPELSSVVVQRALIDHYSRLRNAEYLKIASWLTAGGGDSEA